VGTRSAPTSLSHPSRRWHEPGPPPLRDSREVANAGALEEAPMAIVAGFDVHGAQITFDALDMRRARSSAAAFPRTRSRCAVGSGASRARGSTSRSRPARAGCSCAGALREAAAGACHAGSPPGPAAVCCKLGRLVEARTSARRERGDRTEGGERDVELGRGHQRERRRLDPRNDWAADRRRGRGGARPAEAALRGARGRARPAEPTRVGIRGVCCGSPRLRARVPRAHRHRALPARVEGVGRSPRVGRCRRPRFRLRAALLARLGLCCAHGAVVVGPG
jgi:hypothetical protein